MSLVLAPHLKHFLAHLLPSLPMLRTRRRRRGGRWSTTCSTWMALTSRTHSRDGGESLEHCGRQGAHRLSREVGRGGEGSGCHCCPLLLRGRENVGLAPDERLASWQHLSYRTQRRLDPEGQRCLGGKRLLGPVPGRYRSHRHITWWWTWEQKKLLYYRIVNLIKLQ